MHDLATKTPPDEQVREQLLKLSSDLGWLAKAENKPVGALLIEARSKLDQITAGNSAQEEFNRITAAELATARFDMTYLVEGVLVKDQPAGLVGPKKSLKTNISIDLAVSLATGGRFLGYFNVPERRRMAVMSGESGMATIQETAQRICKAASVNLADTDIIFSDTLPKFGDALNMAGFRRFLERDAIEVVIVDPAYLCLPAEVNAANLFDMGRMLRNVSEACKEAGTTLVLAHHLKKNVANPYAPGQLEDIAWSGFQEYFRQWLLLNRREAYEPGTGTHRLWFSTGGSAGHGCLVGLDVAEGTYDPSGERPRVWDVSVLKAGQVSDAAAERREDKKEQQKAKREQARLKRNRRKLTVIMLDFPDGETLSALADKTKLSRDRAREAMDALVEAGTAVACKILKGKREFDGFKLASCDENQSDTDKAD